MSTQIMIFIYNKKVDSTFPVVYKKILLKSGYFDKIIIDSQIVFTD